MTNRRVAARLAAASLATLVMVVVATVAPAGAADPAARARADWLLARALGANGPLLPGLAAQDEVGGGGAPAFQDGEGGGSKVLPMGMSLLLPGLGEAYLGHKRGYVLMAVDVASWIGVAHYNSKGNDLRDQYYAYADLHWNEGRLISFYDPLSPNPAGAFYFPSFGTVTGIEDLPLGVTQEADRREYYENLGKWDQFVFGWDDFVDPRDYADLGPDYDNADLQDGRVSAHREAYRALRQDSNRQFTNRDRLLYLNMATRLFSVFEVAYLQGLLGGGPKDELAIAGHPVRIIAEPMGWSASRLGISVAY